MSKQVNIIINGKGGVGKSFFAVNFVQYLKDGGVPFLAIDTDNENSTLKRFHPETTFVDIAEPKEIDTIFTTLEQNDLVVVDCRAASTDIFLDYFSELQIFEILAGLDASLTVISPVSHETDSLEQIRQLTDRLENKCRYVIVKNQALTQHFVTYDQSKIRVRLLEEHGAREIVMPKLYDWLVSDLNRHDLSITPALRHEAFSLLDRQRLKNWQKVFNTELEGVRECLLPEHFSKPAKIKANARPTPSAK